MRELSLHILDIVQNSIAASASFIEIRIDENPVRDLLTIEITDDGKGIPEQQLVKVADPFFTSRTTRRVGLGLALLARAAEEAQGELVIRSGVGVGTKVTATFRYSHIDRAPLGDQAGTLLAIIMLNPAIEVVYHHTYQEKSFYLDTREIKSELGAIAIHHPTVASWLEETLRAGIEELYGGD